MTSMDTIYGMVIRGIGEDKMCWKPDQKKGFKVGTFYQQWQEEINQTKQIASIWSNTRYNYLKIDTYHHAKRSLRPTQVALV